MFLTKPFYLFKEQNILCHNTNLHAWTLAELTIKFFFKKTLTHIKLRCESAAGDSQVVCVLLTAEQVHVCVPQLEVSVGAAGHKHLATWGEATGHHTGLADRAAPADDSGAALDLRAHCTGVPWMDSPKFFYHCAGDSTTSLANRKFCIYS